MGSTSVNGCDVVAVRDQEPPVIVELKTGLGFLGRWG